MPPVTVRRLRTALAGVAGAAAVATVCALAAAHPVAGAAKDAVQARVGPGGLTQEQADRLKQRIDAGGPWMHGLGGPAGRAGRRVVQTVAGAVGATPQDVHAQLKAGRSLAEIGAARGKSQADLKNALLDPARQRLATAVAQGKVTRARADTLLERAGSRLDALLTRKRAGAGAGGG
jgi:hypothetical protein